MENRGEYTIRFMFNRRDIQNIPSWTLLVVSRSYDSYPSNLGWSIFFNQTKVGNQHYIPKLSNWDCNAIDGTTSTRKKGDSDLATNMNDGVTSFSSIYYLSLMQLNLGVPWDLG